MAIINPTFGEMRGKLGGQVFSRNKGGPYVRRMAVPTNPNSARQQATRNWLAWCAATWESQLLEAQREQWREWAETHSMLNSLGQSIFLTGLDWYAMVNSRILDFAGTPIEEPGDLTTPDPLLTMSLGITSATVVAITFTPALVALHRLVLWGSGPIGPGQNPNFKQMRLIGYSAAAAASPASFTLPYTLQDASKLKVYCGVMSPRGRESTFLTDDEIYSAP